MGKMSELHIDLMEWIANTPGIIDCGNGKWMTYDDWEELYGKGDECQDKEGV